MAILAHQNLLKIVKGRSPIITGTLSIKDDQIQMASLDLSIGKRIYGMRASALPSEGMSIQSLIDSLSNYQFDLNTTEDKFLKRGSTYIVPLNEGLRLPKGFSAKFSPKSSTGRVDVFVRVLADGVPGFDLVPDRYHGPLYLEITPLSFDIHLREGQRLVQMRIREGDGHLSGRELAVRQADEAIVWGKDGKPIPARQIRTSDRGIFMHVDLEREIVGFVAREPVMNELSFAREDAYEPEQFWEPIPRPADGCIIINPGRFYLLATCERIKIPTDVCGDIAPYDASAGEFRTHYAGFFDPGFGGTAPEDTGTIGVMEVRGREIPFCLRHGQPICRMDFERMDAIPDMLYGQSSKESHYTKSGASLSKFFRRRNQVWKE